jgi:hypothetical protein
MTASRAIQKRAFTPARKIRARISHVSIFQNMGSAHVTPPKTPRKPTSGSEPVLRVFPEFSAIHTPARRFSTPIFAPQFGSKTETDASRNPLAPGAQQTAVD